MDLAQIFYFFIFFILLLFFSNIGVLVVRALNWGFILHSNLALTCVPKGDKRRDLIKNWRSISLLSVVYKIGSAATANRKYKNKINFVTQSNQ